MRGPVSATGSPSFFRNIAVFGSGVAFNALLRLIVLMAAARLLSEGDYGVIDTMLVAGLLFMNIALLGLDSAVHRMAFEGQTAAHRRTIYTSSLILLLPNSGFVALIAGGIVSMDTFPAIALRAETATFFIACYSAGLGITAIGTALLRALHLERRFLTLTFTVFVLRAMSVGVPWLTGVTTLETFLLYIGGGSLLAGMATLFLNRDFLGLSADWRKTIRGMLCYGVPLGLIAVGGALLPTLERTMIIAFELGEYLTRYASSAFPALLLGLSIQLINVAWAPFALYCHKTDRPELTVETGVLGIAATAAGYLVLLYTSPIIVPLAVPTGDPHGHELFPFIGLVVLMRFLSPFAGFGLTVEQHSGYRFACYISGIVSGAVAAVLLLPQLGPVAVPAGFSIGGLIAVVFELVLSQRSRPFAWPLLSLFVLTALIFASALTKQATYGCGDRADCLPSWLAASSPLVGIVSAACAGFLLVRSNWKILRMGHLTRS